MHIMFNISACLNEKVPLDALLSPWKEILRGGPLIGGGEGQKPLRIYLFLRQAFFILV